VMLSFVLAALAGSLVAVMLVISHYIIY